VVLATDGDAYEKGIETSVRNRCLEECASKRENGVSEGTGAGELVGERERR
jgi:hypothetical protein